MKSFADLARQLGSDTDWIDLEDVLSDYADTDVRISENLTKPDELAIVVGTLGVGLPYPFPVSSLFESVDELVEQRCEHENFAG